MRRFLPITLLFILLLVGCGKNEVEYVKFQDRMSMDWDGDQEYLLEKIPMIKGENMNQYGKANTIIIALNRMLSDEYPNTIEEVVVKIAAEEGISLEELKNIKPDESAIKAMELVKYDKYDTTNGALEYE